MGQTTIVLADDHPIVLQGLRAALEIEPDFCIVGEAGDGLEAIKLVERLQPNVLIVDLRMPNLDGLEVTQRINQMGVRTRILIFSIHAAEFYVERALRVGAVGYVLKPGSGAELAQAVREAVAGRRYLSPQLSALDV